MKDSSAKKGEYDDESRTGDTLRIFLGSRNQRKEERTCPLLVQQKEQLLLSAHSGNTRVVLVPAQGEGGAIYSFLPELKAHCVVQ